MKCVDSKACNNGMYAFLISVSSATDMNNQSDNIGNRPSHCGRW